MSKRKQTHEMDVDDEDGSDEQVRLISRALTWTNPTK